LIGKANNRIGAGVAELEKAQGLGPCPVGVRGFKSPPPHDKTIFDKYVSFIKSLELSHISKSEIQAYKSTILSFLKGCSYKLNEDNITSYITMLRDNSSPKTLRNKLIKIRRFLRYINHPLAEEIKLPRVPARRKIIIKKEQIRKLLEDIENLKEKYRIKMRAAVLLAATSGLRAEELYKLRMKDIDLENRTIYIKAEIAKDYEDRVTFFSEEAREVLEDYVSTVGSHYYLFTKKSLNYHLRNLDSELRMKHMRKFFSQQSDRLGMPTSVKKMLMGHSIQGDIDLSHYDFQDEEELKKIYDHFWRDFKIA